MVLRFKPIDRDSMKNRLKDIAKKENFEIDDNSEFSLSQCHDYFELLLVCYLLSPYR